MNQINQALITRDEVFYFLNEDFKKRALPAFYVEQKRIFLTSIQPNVQDAENEELDLFQLDYDVYHASQKSIENWNEGLDSVQQAVDGLDANESALMALMIKGGYIELIRSALELIVTCYNEFHYWGYETKDELFDEFINERLNLNLPELMPGTFFEKSMSAEIIDTITLKLLDPSYLPEIGEVEPMWKHLADFYQILQWIIGEHASNHQQLMEEKENYIYQEEDPQVLIEYARRIGRELINKTVHPDFKKIKEHIGLQIEYLINSRRVNQVQAINLPQKGVQQLTIPLSLEQRSKLFDLLRQGKFIGNENRGRFIWALGSSDEKMPTCWQPIKWEESKLSFRELLTPYLQTITNQQIRIIEKLFLDKHCNPLKLNKLPKADEYSARYLEIEKIVKSLLF